MYTLVVKMRCDPARSSDIRRHFDEDVVPWARSRPGFVSGQWLLGPDAAEGMGVIMFETAEAAETAAQGPRNSRPGPEAAWSIESVTVFEQAASA